MTDDSRTELKQRIKAILVDRLKLDRTPESIGDDEPLFGSEGLGLDSIDALELVLGVEQEFGVKIENEEVGMEALSSVSGLAEFIVAKKPSLVAS
jgi:acyl carrier protein